jgi:hypothetical protein
MTRVRTESNTILVVADISLVTLTPAKLKKAMLTTVPIDGKLSYFTDKIKRDEITNQGMHISATDCY